MTREKYCVIITHNGTETRLDAKPSYRALQAYVARGVTEIENTLIQRTKVRYANRRCDCVVNEEGIPLNLPFNDKATQLYRADWIKEYPGANLGDAALFGTAVIYIGWRF